MKILLTFTLVITLSFQNATSFLILTETTIIAQEDSTDILAEVLAIHADSTRKLSTNFRPGHTTDYIFTDYLTTTEFGYKIKLPANNNIPTATWYDNKIYVSGGFGSKEYFSFHAETGELNWAVGLDDDGPSSCVIEDGIIVYNTESCTIFACDVKTGKQIWSYWLGDPLMSTPTVANGIVYTAYPCGSLYNSNANYNSHELSAGQTINKAPSNYSHALIAIELKTGNILWQKRIEGDILSAPIEENGSLHVVTFSGVYYIVDAKSGEFTSAKRCRATSAPVLFNGRSYYSQRGDLAGEAVSEYVTGYNYQNKIIEVRSEKKEAPYLDKTVQSESKLKSESMTHDAANGFSGGAPEASNWRGAYENIGQSNVSSLQNFYGSRIVSNGNNQYNLMGDTLFCFDSETGKENWKYAISGNIRVEGGYLATAPILAGNYIITATLQGEIILMNKSTGSTVKTYEIKEAVRTQPIAMNGWIYITTNYGNLFAINTQDVSITGWPMLGADNQHSNKLL